MLAYINPNFALEKNIYCEGSATADQPSRSPPKPFITGDFIRLRQASANEITHGYCFIFL